MIFFSHSQWGGGNLAMVSSACQKSAHFCRIFARLIKHNIPSPIDRDAINDSLLRFYGTMVFYYSGCGNSRFVAQEIASTIGERLVFVPQAAREGRYGYTLQDGERVGFVFPIYGWRPPQLVLDFVSRLRLEGRTPYVYIVSTYGDDAGWADKVMEKRLAAMGLPLSAVFGVTMPNTYVNLSFMKLDSPQTVQHKLDRARKRVAEVAKAVIKRKGATEICRGKLAKLKTYGIGVLFGRWVSDKGYRATESCVSCEVCATVCPLKNITIENGIPRWHGNCVHCEACYHYCPQNAVNFSRATQGKGQYHFKEEWVSNSDRMPSER